MAVLVRHPTPLTVVLAAVTATAAVFTFARPVYGSPADTAMIDLAARHSYSAAVVRRVFSAVGLPLPYATSFSGMTTLSAVPPPYDVTALYVDVGPREGRVSWGPKPDSGYEVTFGNLAVHYGGADASVRARVEAAANRLHAAGAARVGFWPSQLEEPELSARTWPLPASLAR